MTRKIATVAFLLASLGLTAGDGGWPLFQGNARRTGLSTGKCPGSWKKKWVVSGNFGNYDGPAVVVGPEGTACAVLEDDRSGNFAVAAWGANGKERWRCLLDDDSLASPAFAPDGGVVLGLLDGSIVKVSAEGKKAWSFKTAGAVTSSSAFAQDGTIYIGSRDDSLYAIAPDGKLKWKFTTGGWVSAAPAIGPDGTVYAVSWDACVYAVSPEGKELWRFRTRRAISACPVVAPDGTVYAASEDGCLYAVGADGKESWKFETDGWIYFPPCLDPAGNIAVASNDGVLRSITPQGKERWRFESGDPESNLVCDARGAVTFVANRTLFVVSTEGKPIWKRADPQVSSLSLGDDGTLFLAGTQFLYALRD
ncbi:MAG: WD40-like repeat [Planctomycetota bacterium]|nr:MAG: WD40-like repeat [Planctomycetota bacterium]